MDKLLTAEDFLKLAKKFDLSIRLRPKAERLAKYLEKNGYGTVPREVIEAVSEVPPPPKPKKKKPDDSGGDPGLHGGGSQCGR